MCEDTRIGSHIASRARVGGSARLSLWGAPGLRVYGLRVYGSTVRGSTDARLTGLWVYGCTANKKPGAMPGLVYYLIVRWASITALSRLSISSSGGLSGCISTVITY